VQRGSRGIALLILNLGARRGGWSAPRPGRFTPGKDPVPIVQEAGWAPGPLWTCVKISPPPGFFFFYSVKTVYCRSYPVYLHLVVPATCTVGPQLQDSIILHLLGHVFRTVNSNGHWWQVQKYLYEAFCKIMLVDFVH
jgi:hypothetical protein